MVMMKYISGQGSVVAGGYGGSTVIQPVLCSTPV